MRKRFCQRHRPVPSRPPAYHRPVAITRDRAPRHGRLLCVGGVGKQPELKGKPVVVCGSGPRAVVTTASYEARKLGGIRSAMPAAVARRRLPDAVYLPPDFPAYREASAVVMEVLRATSRWWRWSGWTRPTST